MENNAIIYLGRAKYGDWNDEGPLSKKQRRKGNIVYGGFKTKVTPEIEKLTDICRDNTVWICRYMQNMM